MSGLDLTLNPDRQPRRFEVINGAGGRRRWSMDDKARIIAETPRNRTQSFPKSPGVTVSGRSRCSPGGAKRANQAASAQQESPTFVPAVVTPPEPAPMRPAPEKRKVARDAGVIELEIEGVAMRVGRGADAKTVAAVIRALKATS